MVWSAWFYFYWVSGDHAPYKWFHIQHLLSLDTHECKFTASLVNHGKITARPWKLNPANLNLSGPKPKLNTWTSGPCNLLTIDPAPSGPIAHKHTHKHTPTNPQTHPHTHTQLWRSVFCVCDIVTWQLTHVHWLCKSSLPYQGSRNRRTLLCIEQDGRSGVEGAVTPIWLAHRCDRICLYSYSHI